MKPILPFLAAVAMLGLSPRLGAQRAVPLQHAIAIAPATLYLNPSATSAKIGAIEAGKAIGIQAKSGAYVQVFSGISGWMPDHGLVRLSDPNAAETIFGAAVALQMRAEASSGQERAARQATQLYLDVYHDFPHSSRAAEALYRGASIRWQMKLGDEPRSTPSEREFPDTHDLKQVGKKFRGTPWAARADYDLLVTHFTCGDWTEKPSCIGKEARRYQDYVKKYPHGPKSAEAAYDALYREAIAWTVYSQPGKRHDRSQAGRYRQAVAAGAVSLERAYPRTDWSALAAMVAFNTAHGTYMKVPGLTPLGGP